MVGICLVLLAQQFGFIDLGATVLAIVYLVAFAVVFGIVFGLLGIWLGARYMRKHAPGLTAWKSTPATPAASTPPLPEATTPAESEPALK